MAWRWGLQPRAVGMGPGVSQGCGREEKGAPGKCRSPLHCPALADSPDIIAPAMEGPQTGSLLLLALWDTDVQGTLSGASLIPRRDVVKVLGPSWTELPCLLQSLCPKSR